MKNLIIAAGLLLTACGATAQKLNQQEISINGFRNPSIGVEYRYHFLSAHAGYYLTNFRSGQTTRFLRGGVTAWFLPVGKKVVPSSFYASISYARGLSRYYDGKNAMLAEAGFRWMAYKGLNLRLGVAALAAKNQSVKVNPTPGISYSFKLK